MQEFEWVAFTTKCFWRRNQKIINIYDIYIYIYIYIYSVSKEIVTKYQLCEAVLKLNANISIHCHNASMPMLRRYNVHLSLVC